jgi:hypothetical protein
MKSMTPHGITGLETVLSGKIRINVSSTPNVDGFLTETVKELHIRDFCT